LKSSYKGKTNITANVMPVNPISMNISQLGIICPLGELCKAEERMVVQLTRGRKIDVPGLTLTTLDLSLLAHCSSPIVV